MTGENHYISSFENVHATCGGVDISAILEIHVSAPANGVPTITLLVDGGNSDGDWTGVDGKVSLDDSRGIFDTCRAMLKTDSATLTLSLTVRTVHAGGESTQSLDITGWMLIDVSISPVRKDSVCAAALTFAHPLYKASLGGAMPGLLITPPLLAAVAGKNPLELFIQAFKAYANTPRMEMPNLSVPNARSMAEISASLLGHMATAVSALESHVSWAGEPGLPAAGVLGQSIDALWYGIAAYGTPSSNSVLHTMFSSFIPECSLALGGDYTADSLELRPFTPWADPSFSIQDDDIIIFDFPQADPTPISGVHLITADGSGRDVVSYNVLGGQLGDGTKSVDIFYVPQSELDAEYMYGPIHQFTAPGWLLHTIASGAGLKAAVESDTTTVQGGSFNSVVTVPRNGSAALSGGTGTAPAVDYGRASVLCAKAYFETAYRKDWTFGLTTRLMFDEGGGKLFPGRVLTVNTESGDVIGGYVTLVEHVISVSSKTAITKVRCSHPRFGKRPAAITSGNNALYE